MKFLKFAPALLTLMVLQACDRAPKADTPEGALERYVHVAFNAKDTSDKQRLAELSTGEALQYLHNMTDEDFKKQFLNAPLSLVRLKAKDLRKEEGGDVSLMYEIEFREGKSGQSSVISNKKIAYLTQTNGSWKIKSTKNLKSFVEQKQDLVITPGIDELVNTPESAPKQGGGKK